MFRKIKNKLLIGAASAAIGFNVSGCPQRDGDADNDGISDSIDGCVTQQETFNGYQDTDGCPDTLPGSGGNGDTDGDDNFTSSLENLLENPSDARHRIDDLFSAIGERYAKYGADRAMSLVEQDLASNIKTAGRMDKLEDASRELDGNVIVFDLPDTFLNKLVPQAINKPIVFYVNGITTTIPDYINQLYALRGALKELDIDLGVTGFYNESFSEVKINGVKVCPLIRLAPF
ncbi:MAG: hypothetical protein AABX90_02590, partial [Nanoarchaeota archaeon]